LCGANPNEHYKTVAPTSREDIFSVCTTLILCFVAFIRLCQTTLKFYADVKPSGLAHEKTDEITYETKDCFEDQALARPEGVPEKHLLVWRLFQSRFFVSRVSLLTFLVGTRK